MTNPDSTHNTSRAKIPIFPLADMAGLAFRRLKRRDTIFQLSRIAREGAEPLRRLITEARNNKEVRRLLRAGTDVTFIASFFRSGNTWTRCLLADVLLQNRGFQTTTADSERLSRIVPDIYGDLVARRDAPPQEALAVKSHETFDGIRSFFGHGAVGRARTLYLFRAPEDALVSYYHFRQLGAKGERRGPDIEKFCQREFPVWREHVSSYLEGLEQGAPIFFMSYERLLKDTDAALVSMLRWLGIEQTPGRVRCAVENMKFANLRAMEEEQRADKGSAEFFFRKGRAGSGAAELSSGIVSRIRDEGAPLLETLERAAAACQAALASGTCPGASAGWSARGEVSLLL